MARRRKKPKVIRPARRSPIRKSKPRRKIGVIKALRGTEPKKPLKAIRRSTPKSTISKVIRPVKGSSKLPLRARPDLFNLPRSKSGFQAANPAKYRKIRNLIHSFDDQVVEIISSEMKKISEGFAKYVRMVIHRQRYKWKPLSERYLKWKKDQNLDLRILIATKAYVQSIRAYPVRQDKRVVSWGVGPGKPGEKHEPSGLTLRTLSRWLEFGTLRMPARPHWRPAWSAYIRNKNLYARQIMKKVINRQRKARR